MTEVLIWRFGGLTRLPIPARDKIDLALPAFTLDVNQITLKEPRRLPHNMNGLVCLEYNYFAAGRVELCVTPETAIEITQGVDVNSLGPIAYRRIQKTQLFKARPPSARLELTDEESTELWLDVRQQLWPHVADRDLNVQQRGDVNQLFFHIVCNSTVTNAAFVTLDGNFLNRAPGLLQRYGITVQSPEDAWGESQRRYGLPTPSTQDIDHIWRNQQQLFVRLLSSSA